MNSKDNRSGLRLMAWALTLVSAGAVGVWIARNYYLPHQHVYPDSETKRRISEAYRVIEDQLKTDPHFLMTVEKAIHTNIVTLHELKILLSAWHNMLPTNDGFGNPLLFELHNVIGTPQFTDVEIWSMGPNGINNNRTEDDIF